PAAVLLPIGGGLDPGAELDVLLEIEAISDEVQPLLGLRLPWKTLAWLPRFVQVLGKPILVHLDLRIEARTGVTIPVPGSADAGTRLEGADLQPQLPHAVQLVQTRDASPDNDRIEGRLFCSVRFSGLDFSLVHFPLLLFLATHRAARPNGRSGVSLAIQRNCWAGLRAPKGLEPLTHRQRKVPETSCPEARR